MKEDAKFPMLIWENKQEKANRIEIVTRLQRKIKEIAKEWEAMKIGCIPGTLGDLLSDPRVTHQAALRREIQNELPPATRFKHDIDKILQTYITPKPDKMIEQIKQLLPSDIDRAIRFFTIDDGEIKQTPAVDKWLTDADLFAADEQDKQVWDDLCIIAEKLNGFNELAGFIKIPAHINIGRIFTFNQATEKFEADDRGFKIVKSKADLFN